MGTEVMAFFVSLGGEQWHHFPESSPDVVNNSVTFRKAALMS